MRLLIRLFVVIILPQGFSFELAEKGVLNLIQLVFQNDDSAYEDICSTGYFSSSTDSTTQANESLTVSEFISATLHCVCSCDHDILLTSAMSELLMLPVIYQTLHLPTPVSGPTDASATPLPLFHQISVDTIMSHPIAR